MARVRLIHDPQASAAAASKLFVWLPHAGRRSQMMAGVEHNLEDLDLLISALFRTRERLRNEARVKRRQNVDVSHLEAEHAALRKIENHLTLARDDLKQEQAWRDYATRHPGRI